MQDPNQSPNPEPQPLPQLNPDPAVGTPQLPELPNGSYYQPIVRQTNTLAVVSLVASILAWLGLFGIGGIIGIITGSIARREIRASNGRQEGDGIALTGIILGGVNVVLTCLAVLCLVAVFVGIPTLGVAMDGFK